MSIKDWLKELHGGKEAAQETFETEYGKLTTDALTAKALEYQQHIASMEQAKRQLLAQTSVQNQLNDYERAVRNQYASGVTIGQRGSIYPLGTESNPYKRKDWRRKYDAQVQPDLHSWSRTFALRPKKGSDITDWFKLLKWSEQIEPRTGFKVSVNMARTVVVISIPFEDYADGDMMPARMETLLDELGGGNELP